VELAIIWGTSMIIASIDDYRKQCEARLPRFLYDYISGGSFQENALHANIAELQATLPRQRVMVDESHLNLSMARISSLGSRFDTSVKASRVPHCAS
jgi:isopentenyl diphosphate isomerase/L-lactate dehydrogenase-like FMN-dependent dehydrogenase